MTGQHITSLLSFISLGSFALSEPVPHYQYQGHALVFDEIETLRAVQKHPHFFGKREVSSLAEVTNGTFYLERRASSSRTTGVTCGNVNTAGSESDDGDNPPTRIPGMGVEFETNNVYAKYDPDFPNCNDDAWADSKGLPWLGHSGALWELTGDTTSKPYLAAEYIIDGVKCQIGANMAGPATGEIAADILSWAPARGEMVSIPQSQCHAWTIHIPEEPTGLDEAIWGIQVTSGMPLEAIKDIIAAAGVSYSTNKLLDPNSVRDDVLGFLSLVVSYAKRAEMLSFNVSPKTLTSIMPRTDFVGLYRQVKNGLPANLYELIQILACYKLFDGEYIDIDLDFCDYGNTPGDPPQPKGTLDSKIFGVTVAVNGKDEASTVSVREWIDSIEADVSPDKLSLLDQKVDRSIGRFGTRLEPMYGGSTRQVPIFEFRELDGKKAIDLRSFVEQVEAIIMSLHEKYQTAPS